MQASMPVYGELIAKEVVRVCILHKGHRFPVPALPSSSHEDHMILLWSHVSCFCHVIGPLRLMVNTCPLFPIISLRIYTLRVALCFRKHHVVRLRQFRALFPRVPLHCASCLLTSACLLHLRIILFLTPASLGLDPRLGLRLYSLHAP